IVSWFNSFYQYIYLTDFEKALKESRYQAQNWLKCSLEELRCELPFFVFSDRDFDEIKPFLHTTHLMEFNKLLKMWPQDELDLIVLANCLTNYWIIDDLTHIFEKKSVYLWLLSNEKKLEELFWKTSDSVVQKLVSDALEVIKYAVKFWKQ